LMREAMMNTADGVKTTAQLIPTLAHVLMAYAPALYLTCQVGRALADTPQETICLWAKQQHALMKLILFAGL